MRDLKKDAIIGAAVVASLFAITGLLAFVCNAFYNFTH